MDKASIVEEIKFYVEHTPPFLGVSRDIMEAELILLGVPYDYTSTYRPGSRFAPNAIREASMYMEAYASASGRSCENPCLSDIGNLIVSNDVGETLTRLGRVASHIRELGKVQVAIGGEHTVTRGCIPSLIGGDGGLLCFDAHLDLRDEFQGTRLNHATFMRRIIEEVGPEKILLMGVRAFSREELDYASEMGIRMISAKKFTSLSLEALREIVRRTMGGRPLYVSIDFDVVDPSFAPAVGNPEPGGVHPMKLAELLSGVIMDSEVAGVDLVEVSPKYDEGETAILAAKILLEIISAIETSRSSSASL
jgi:agmatinase